MFSRFVATLISLKIIKNPGRLKFTDLPHGILFCQERPGILEGTHKSNFFIQSILWMLFPDASFFLCKASTQQNRFFKKKRNKILGLLIFSIGTNDKKLARYICSLVDQLTFIIIFLLHHF